MRRRPQPNPARGFLRAGIVVVVLIVIVVAVIAVVTSVTAPPVHAPAPTVIPTPGTPFVPTPARTTTPTPARSPVPRKTSSKDVSLGGSFPERRGSLSESRRGEQSERTLTPWVAEFSGPRDAYNAVLVVHSRSGSIRRRVGRADRYITPVWSPDGQTLLYAQVTATHHDPGARWTLWRYGPGQRAPRRLASMTALNLRPLGWQRGEPAFLATTATDSSLFRVAGGHTVFGGIVIPQPVSYGSLSPSGRWIAVTAPTSCRFCTLDIYDTASQTLANGPDGIPRESEVAWTVDGHTLLTNLHGRLTAVDAASLKTQILPWPSGLPSTWSHPMRARLSATALVLTDLVTGRRYRSDVANS